jgi:hypothetical protein
LYCLHCFPSMMWYRKASACIAVLSLHCCHYSCGLVCAYLQIRLGLGPSSEAHLLQWAWCSTAHPKSPTARGSSGGWGCCTELAQTPVSTTTVPMARQ